MNDMTPEEAADIALGSLLDHGIPMDTAAAWADCVKSLHEQLADVRRLRELCKKNQRASFAVLLLAGGMVLCNLIVATVNLFL